MCFESIEMNFEKYGPIVLVTAHNLDAASEDKSSSNGAGKSSLPEIPVFALYGETIKKPKKLKNPDLVNHKNGKKLSVEFRWDDYRVVRTCDVKGKNTLKIWKSAEGVYDKTTEITRGGIPTTQKYLEEEILKMSYNTFVNLYIFNADDPTSTFLECDLPTKREIVENLLSLDKYRTYNENAKEFVKIEKDKIKLLTRDYEHLINDLESCRARVVKIEQQETEWKKSREQEVVNLVASIQKKMQQLESTDVGAALSAYTEAQQQIKELQESIPVLEAKRDKSQQIVEIGTPKLQQAEQKFEEIHKTYKDTWKIIENCMSDIKNNEKTIADAIVKAGDTECPYCFGKIDESNFSMVISKAEEVIKNKKAEIEAINPAWTDISEEYKKQGDIVTKLEKGVTFAKQQLAILEKELTGVHASIARLSKIKEPQAGINERLIQEQIEEIKKQLAAKQAEVDGPSPFNKIHESATQEFVVKSTEVQTKKDDMEKAEKDMPYYEFWVKAFGDTGIRKYIIEGIIPALNNRIAHWLQFLIDNKIKLVFDNQLKETIDRYPFLGRPYVYHGCSGGQRRRLNLSVAASFAYIQLLNVGCSPSVVWLDEVTMNMDEIGVDGIYRMICELAKERQVFVIDHNQALLQMLDGCDKIQLVMKDEVTKMVN